MISDFLLVWDRHAIIVSHRAGATVAARTMGSLHAQKGSLVGRRDEASTHLGMKPVGRRRVEHNSANAAPEPNPAVIPSDVVQVGTIVAGVVPTARIVAGIDELVVIRELTLAPILDEHWGDPTPSLVTYWVVKVVRGEVTIGAKLEMFLHGVETVLGPELPEVVTLGSGPS